MRPIDQHILDAIQHASDFSPQTLSREDFILRYEGFLTVDQLDQFDDLSSWMEVIEIDDLGSYRRGTWNVPKHDVPPVIVITAPGEGASSQTQVGDGRGRINYASVHNMKLHVWHLVHKSTCTDGDSLNSAERGDMF